MPRRRIVLYNPPTVFFTMPLGLLAVASGLDPARWDVEIVDGRLHREPVGTLLAALDGADTLGIGVLTGDPIRHALEASRAARSRYPRLHVVWGGWHPSLFPESCLREAPIDAVVVGAGQRAFSRLVEAWAGGGDLAALPGVAARTPGGEIVHGPPGELPELDALPPLDYGRIDVDAYFARKGRRQLDYIGSVGCRFRCAFCADPQVYQRSWTGMTADRMGGELSSLVRRHRAHEVAFQDETFFTKRSRIDELCDALLRGGVAFRWTATLRADQGARMPVSLLERCRDLGFDHAIIGVESAYEPMLKQIRKDVRMDQVWETASRLRDLGIGATWNFIVGFAGEPEESVMASLDAARRLRAMSPRFRTPIFFYKPYPGSPTAEAVERAGFPLPRTLEGWSRFDFVGADARSPWMDPRLRTRVERFGFYQDHAYGAPTPPWKWPLRVAARLRVETGRFGMPVEKLLVERLRPSERLS